MADQATPVDGNAPRDQPVPRSRGGEPVLGDPLSVDPLPEGSLGLGDDAGAEGSGVDSTVPPVAAAPLPPATTFADLTARARRLVEWAAEESRYVREHDVSTFSAADRRGRDRFADEGLYELLPRLLLDAAALRLQCGRGPLWDEAKALCDQAAADVQRYHLLWHRARDGQPIT